MQTLLAILLALRGSKPPEKSNQPFKLPRRGSEWKPHLRRHRAKEVLGRMKEVRLRFLNRARLSSIPIANLRHTFGTLLLRRHSQHYLEPGANGRDWTTHVRFSISNYRFHAQIQGTPAPLG